MLQQESNDSCGDGAVFAERPCTAQLHTQHLVAMRCSEDARRWTDAAGEYLSLAAELFHGTSAASPLHRDPHCRFASLAAAMVLFDESRSKQAGYFAKEVLPLITAAALNFDAVLPLKIPLLRQSPCSAPPSSVSFSRRQCFTILAAAFLCAFPRQHYHGKGDVELPGINYDRLFHSSAHFAETHKLVMHFDYFADMGARLLGHLDPDLDDPLKGVMFGRLTAPEVLLSEGSLAACKFTPLVVHPLRESIDHQVAMTRVDFANMYIGGGSLGAGCVQEEITFSVCPELNVSRYVCERMADHEAIVLLNSIVFSSIVPGSYGRTTRHLAAVDSGRTPTPNVITAVDALHFRFGDPAQFSAQQIRRELVKALAGFQPLPSSILDFSSGPATLRQQLATGNWGCGAFNGDVELKAIIQWIAASLSGREMHYFPFDNERVFHAFPMLAAAIVDKNISAGEVLECITTEVPRVALGCSRCSVFDVLSQTFGLKTPSGV
jgi:poly(ADP-ribose) glycohydrolase